MEEYQEERRIKAAIIWKEEYFIQEIGEIYRGFVNEMKDRSVANGYEAVARDDISLGPLLSDAQTNLFQFQPKRSQG